MKSYKVAELSQMRAVIIEYLLAKVTMEDWHAVSDAATDLREIDVKIQTLKEAKDKD